MPGKEWKDATTLTTTNVFCFDKIEFQNAFVKYNMLCICPKFEVLFRFLFRNV